VDLSNGKSLQNNNLHNNKYHFLFSFFILVTNLNPEQDRPFMLGFQYSGTVYAESQPFPAFSGQEGGLSVARFFCGPVGQLYWEAVRQWDCGEGVQRPRPTLPKREPSPAEPCSCPGPARPNPAKPSGFVVSAVACAGIEIYNLVNVTELYNGVKKKKGYIINYPGFY